MTPVILRQEWKYMPTGTLINEKSSQNQKSKSSFEPSLLSLFI